MILSTSFKRCHNIRFSSLSSTFRSRISVIRNYRVLAIETSCDDTSVCLIDRPGRDSPPVLIAHQKHSLDTTETGGIIPLQAHLLHQKMTAYTVNEILKPIRNDVYTQQNGGKPVDLICATRGPGMGSSLAAGYDVAKGLSVAFDVPLVGVHHMLGHLLTPRMFAWSESNSSGGCVGGGGGVPLPQFPFLSLLASGGHTMLVLSESLLQHKIVANTLDIAAGDILDKCARELGLKGIMLARVMEAFINENKNQPNDGQNKIYSSLRLPEPLKNTKDRINIPAFSFAPFISSLRTNLNELYPGYTPATLAEMAPEQHRRQMASEIQASVFRHIIERIKVTVDPSALSKTKRKDLEKKLKKNTISKEELALLQEKESSHKEENQGLLHIKDLVLSGGVGANQTFRQMLQDSLPHIDTFHFPDPKWCSDNAVMIGWAGIELYESGLTSDIQTYSVPRWSLEDLMALDGWVHNGKKL